VNPKNITTKFDITIQVQNYFFLYTLIVWENVTCFHLGYIVIVILNFLKMVCW